LSLFYIIFFSIVLAYVLFSLIYFSFFTDKYVENLQLLRKIFYVIYVVGVGLGIIFGEIDMSKWQELFYLTATFIFMDLAVFQTPDILKIWKAEFQHNNYIRKIIKKNEEIIGYNFKKVQRFTDVISITEDHFDTRNVPTQWRQYKDELRTYLNLYADTFQFHVSIFEFDTTADADLLKTSITHALNRVEQCYNQTVDEADGWKEGLIQQLLDGKSIELRNKKEEKDSNIPGELKNKVFIVAYYGKSYNMLIGVSSKFVEVDGIDASHILNLAQIYDWYMV
jgi:Toxin SpoIISA, type II toxin-antitoxin system